VPSKNPVIAPLGYYADVVRKLHISDPAAVLAGGEKKKTSLPSWLRVRLEEWRVGNGAAHLENYSERFHSFR